MAKQRELLREEQEFVDALVSILPSVIARKALGQIVVHNKSHFTPADICGGARGPVSLFSYPEITAKFMPGIVSAGPSGPSGKRVGRLAAFGSI